MLEDGRSLDRCVVGRMSVPICKEVGEEERYPCAHVWLLKELEPMCLVSWE